MRTIIFARNLTRAFSPITRRFEIMDGMGDDVVTYSLSGVRRQIKIKFIALEIRLPFFCERST
jgi:hypothetical protein